MSALRCCSSRRVKIFSHMSLVTAESMTAESNKISEAISTVSSERNSKSSIPMHSFNDDVGNSLSVDELVEAVYITKM